jgi:ParB-like chromosome segregation protein Spo0J
MELTDEFKANIIETARMLRGHDRRLFMARTVRSLGQGGQRRAEAEFGWSRVTIRKGMHELRSGITCCDAYSFRGRSRAEEKLPRLLDDIRDIAKRFSQTDPQFRNRRLYTKLTAEELRRQLIAQRGYSSTELPTPRSLRTKLNDLGFHLTKVAKCKPKKRSSRPMRSSRN